MLKANPIWEIDKDTVLEWMRLNCFGFRSARIRANILPCILFKNNFKTDEGKDRYFRRIASILKHEGHLASTNDRGYWFVPLYTHDAEEVKAALESVAEMESKALDMLKDASKLKERFQDKLRQINQGQLAFI